MAIELTPSFPGLGQSFVPEIQRGQKGDKGDTGNSGVYVGTTEPTDPEVKIWLNPEGETQPGRFVRYDDVQSLSNEQKSIARANIGAASGSSSSGGSARPTIYCWGDSLTEGVNAYVMPPDNRNALMVYGYPAWLSQSFDVVNLGARGEDIQAIMARQGADPIVIRTAFTIPASKSTPVKIGEVSRMFTYGAGSGLYNRTGALVKINKEVESPGLNPCMINGVEGIIYRELKSSLDDNTTYNYYFRRLEDGTDTSVPVGTEVQTQAMRYYRNGYAVIWMGANGGYSSHQDFVNKIKAMVEYGKYEDYLVILSREFAEQYARDIMTLLTDEDGICHVIYLMDELPYRGYAMAGISTHNIDTSGWSTTDPIKKNAPLLCDYISGQSGENEYGGLHFSAWGYKAIAKLVEEKLMTMVKLTTTSSGGGSGGQDSNEDEYGELLYKLSAPKTLNGTNYINTKVKLYQDVSSNWTLVCKYSGTVVCDDGYPYNIFCCFHDGEYDGVLMRYQSDDGQAVYLGSGGFSLGASANNNTSINLNGTNVVIIAKEGDKYRFYCNNTTCAYDVPLTYALASDKAHDLPLILGARWSANAQEVQYRTKITFEDVRVYNAALDEADILDLYNELVGDE